ncbi:MAG: ankyrin repeat domain-containing protein [Verrucomicrobiales bacterium]
MKTPTTVLVVLLLAALPLSGQQPADSKTLLQQALFAEEAEQRLDKAAEGYERIIGNYAAERGFAVVAIYRLAEVRRMQEREDEAVKLYQRILREFPDADPQARLSGERLRAMGVAVAAPNDLEIPNDPDEDKELRRLMLLSGNSPGRVWENVPQRQRSDISPLANAASRGWLRVATWLLDHTEGGGENPIERDQPLYRAAQRGHLDLCRLLHARGAEMGAAETALIDAIQQGFEPVADWLVESGADINCVGQGWVEATDGSKQGFTDPETGARRQVPSRTSAFLSPLAAAVASGRKPWIDRLLDLGADVDRLDRRETTPAISALTVACLKGEAALVRRLLAAGADVRIEETLQKTSTSLVRALPTSGTGWTPLHYGATHPEIIKALLAAGADPRAADSTGVRPIHVAAMANDPACVRLLAGAGADIDVEADLKLASRVLIGGKQYEFLGRSPLLIALDRSDPPAAQPVIAELIELGASIPYDRHTDFGEVPANLIYLSEEFLFPKLAELPAISIAFPEAARSFGLVVPGEGGGDPPDFASALLGWANQEEVRRPRDFGFDWANPTLWRRGAGGEFSKTKVDIMAEGGYPDLQWGDIIAFSSGQIDRETVPPKYSDNSGDRRNPYVETSLPDEVVFALRGASAFEIGLATEAGVRTTLTVDSVLAVRTPPWTRVPDDAFKIFDPVFGAGGDRTKSVTIRRGTETHALERAPDGSAPKFPLEAGDEIISLDGEPDRERSRHIALVEPGNPMLLFSTVAGTRDESETGGAYAGRWGTLFQLLATAYSMAALPPTVDAPGEQELRATARRRLGGNLQILTHPDFSSIRIRRLGEDTEEVIDVPMAEFIAACGPDTDPAECRAKDVWLQPGDIVELKPLEGRVGEPWNGFDAATARFLEKALTYQLRIRPLQGNEISTTISWKAPLFHPTKAGPVGILADSKSLRFPTRYEALRLLLPEARGVCTNSSGSLCDGMLIEQRPRKSMQPSGSRRRVVLPPTPR